MENLFKSLEKISLSVVVPVFNEEQNIIGNIKVLQNELDNFFLNFEIIIVNDGSTDQTEKVVKDYKGDRIKLISFDKNKGKGAAIRKGFEESLYDFILFIDGGMELHPREIKIFLGLMFLYEADIVIGSKRHPQSTIMYPWYRRFLSLLYQFIIKLMFGLNVTDTQVGIKMFRRKVIKDILPWLDINSYGFDLEVLALARIKGYSNILEAPVRLDYFLKNKKSIIGDVFHTVRVGMLLVVDTIQLWFKLKKVLKG